MHRRMKSLLLLLLFITVTISCFLAKGTVGMVTVKTKTKFTASSLIRIPQKIWREAAWQHQQQIYDLLKPGLITTTTATTTKSKKNKKQSSLSTTTTTTTTSTTNNNDNDDNVIDWIAPKLDPKHPVYNFLIEYYGLKGSKGIRRLARWSPSPNLFLMSLAQQQEESKKDVITKEITSIEQLYDLSSSSNFNNNNYYYCNDFLNNNKPTTSKKKDINSIIKNSAATILLEGATESDFASTLHLKGSILLPEEGKDGGGVAYMCPSQYYGTNNDNKQQQNTIKSSSSFLWYKSILQQTLDREPILNCFGLHEWAMQYHPMGADPPPSAKYQKHLPMRVSRQIINDTVENTKGGISCTHVDALRFFAKDAVPLNKFKNNNGQLSRKDQIRFEQPACVHANMDLLKLTLKLQPYVDSTLLQNVLRMALESRKLDVGASPYDARSYGIDVIYPIETSEGRAMYKRKQYELMKQIQPIRQELLNAYEIFLKLAFDDDIINLGLQELPSTAATAPTTSKSSSEVSTASTAEQ